MFVTPFYTSIHIYTVKVKAMLLSFCIDGMECEYGIDILSIEMHNTYK